MTIKEAQYFKKYIDERLNDILGAMTQQQLNTLQGQRFAARFMGDIKGQQMLPQSVFRQFLNEIDFSEAKQLHDDLVKAQGQIEQALQQAEQVSDMNSLHYTDVGGEETPFYIYIDMDDPELAGVSADDETALWQGIDRILQAKRTNNVQIVDLNINHRGLHECSYLYFSTSVVKSNRRIEHEYLWSAEGYYKRAVYQNGVTGEWEWRDTYADIAAAQTAAEAAQATADGKADKVHSHTSIGTLSTLVEADGSNVKVYDGNGVQVFKTLNKFSDSETRKRIGVEFRSSDDAENEYTIGEVTNKRTFFKTVNASTNSKLTLDATTSLSNDDKGITLDGNGAKIKSNIGYVEITSTQTRVNHKNKVVIGIDGYNIVKVDGNETVLENAQTKSMGLRLKADQSELKFGGKGITVTETETKVTSSGKVELLAPSVEARDIQGNPIFSTGRYTKNDSTTDEKQTIIFVGNKEYHAGDGTSAEIVLNGDIELCTALQELQSKRTRFEMPMTVEWILSKGKLLNGKFCDYLYNAITLYYGNYDYENDDNSGMLRMLSGENIYPVILSKYYHVGEKTAHAQHFKPWQVEFYDEIQSYDNPEGVVSIPVIRIHIGEDFAEWLVHTGYKGLSEKVSYLEFGIGRDEMGKMPFSIYNASGTKLQEFTLI